MDRIIEKELVETALANGITRKEGVRAYPGQPLTYILTDKMFYHHANIASAKAEKEFLQIALHKNIRIYKVWNMSGEAIEADMTLIRNEAEKLPTKAGFYEALNRMLLGAGY